MADSTWKIVYRSLYIVYRNVKRNPKREYLNPKQIQMSKFKTVERNNRVIASLQGVAISWNRSPRRLAPPKKLTRSHMPKEVSFIDNLHTTHGGRMLAMTARFGHLIFAF